MSLGYRIGTHTTYTTFSSGLKVGEQAGHLSPDPQRGRRARNVVEKLSPPETGWGRRKSQVEELAPPKPGWGRRTSILSEKEHDDPLKSTEQRDCEGKNGENLSGKRRPLEDTSSILNPSQGNTSRNLDGRSSRALRKNSQISRNTQDSGVLRASQTQHMNTSISKMTSFPTKPEMRISIPSNEFRKTGNASPSSIWQKTMMSSPGYENRLKWYQRRDYRRKTLLIVTVFNMLFGAVMILLYFLGPSYPGHFGTFENEWNGARKLIVENCPIYSDSCSSSDVQVANDSILNSVLIAGIVIWFLQPVAAYSILEKVVERGALCQLLSGGMCAITCLGAAIVILLDMEFVLHCCMELPNRCEQSNMCTPIVRTCCFGTEVESYCGNQTYQYLALITTVIVTISCQAQAVMSCTAGCRCWLDSDPEKNELIMWVSTPRTPASSSSSIYTSSLGSPGPPGSPVWSPRKIPSPSGPPRMAKQLQRPSSAPRSSRSSRALPFSEQPEEKHSLQQPITATPVMRNRRGPTFTHDDLCVISQEAKEIPPRSVSSSHRSDITVSNGSKHVLHVPSKSLTSLP